ncbi:MAG: ferritin [Pseudomonadota bacterium]|jgi:hypothetical protein
MTVRSPTDALLQKFCRDVVHKTLLMSSLGVLGCNRAPAGPPAPVRPMRPALDASAAIDHDAATPSDSAVMTHKPTLPVLRASQVLIASGDAFATFPCAEPPESPALHESLVDHPRHNQDHADRDEREWDRVARTLSLDADYDFVEVVRVTGPGQVGMAGDRLRPVPIVLARAGTPCSTASQLARCERAVQQARTSVFGGVRCEGEICSEFDLAYALTTRADNVVVHQASKGLIRLFAGVDTPSEAWLLLAADKRAYQLSCEDPVYARQRKVPGGYELATRMYTSRCQPLLQEDLVYRVDSKGKIRLVQRKDVTRDPQGCVVSGRRPASLCALEVESSGAGALFARMAYLERASVTAFEIMHDELRALGAPAALLARVERARGDELRHTEAMERWAARLGQDVPQPDHAKGAPRSALAVARENAVEGCARELFGALVVRLQAERTSLPGLRQDLTRIADDEAAHASLAIDVASWLEPQLTREERASIDADVARALAELASELTEPSPELLAFCGLPTRKESRALLVHVERALSTLRMTPIRG